MDEKQLLEYAVERFEQGVYDEALEAFVLAYCKGYEREWILENIYTCYMSGNEPEFQKTYETSAATERCAYEDCMIDFIPYKEGEYFLFDKECREFRGTFSMEKLTQTLPSPVFEGMEFSAAVLVTDWNWSQIMPALVEAKERRLYVICADQQRCLSFYKIPELAEYMKNIMVFADEQELQQYFHTYTAEYLPRIVVAGEECKARITRILEEEHAYRLTPEGRSTDNVLLTIAIPTFNRGYLLADRVKNLLEMNYDAEIEVTVSKNGVTYEEEYAQAAQLMDARFCYHDHHRTLETATRNWHYAVEMAHGKYVMLVSDEDDVIIQSLEHYLKVFSSADGLAIARVRGTYQNARIVEYKYCKKGMEAFIESFLTQNYLSGLTVNRELFLQANVLQYETLTDNVFYQYYPHEWWCAAMARLGDYMEDPCLLIWERESVLTGEIAKMIEEGRLEAGAVMDENTSLPMYASYEARLRQFQGQVDFLQMYMQDDMQGMEEGLTQSVYKIAYLMGMAREYRYKQDEFAFYINEFLTQAVQAVDRFPFTDEQKVKLLDVIQKNGIYMLNKDRQCRMEEKEHEAV